MTAVLFDLFETLVSYFDPEWKPPVLTIAQRLGIDQRFYDENWGRFDKQWQAGSIEHYEDALAGLCAAANVRPDDRVLAQLKTEYVAYAARTAFVQAESAIVELLSTLESAGFKLGVVTNANNLDSAPWADHELARFFDVFVASHRVRLLKPDRRIFALACEQLQVEPGAAVFVGDGGSDELAGARAAGLQPLWCTWFLDRWPEGIRPNGFPGDGWRQHPSDSDAPYPRVRRPEDLLGMLLAVQAG